LRHLPLTACFVLLVGPACVDLTRPHATTPDASSEAGSPDDGAGESPEEAGAEVPADVRGPDATGDGADAPPAHVGLIGYWKLDSLTGAVAIDSSAMGHNGMITGTPSLTTSSLPPLMFDDAAAFTFAAIDDAVQVPDAPSLDPTELTVALWVRFTTAAGHDSCGSTPTGLQYLFHKRTPRTNGNIEAVALVRTQDNRFGFILGDSAGARTEVDDTPAGVASLATGIWYHVVGTFDMTQARLYINGALNSTGIALRSNPVEFGTTPVFLGRSGECVARASGDTNWEAELSGSLDDVRYYDRALSALEVKALYEGQDF
jgi:hypothetical protein